MPTEIDVRESPTGWFVRLEMAVERGDFEAAAEAQRELKRLGITVKWPITRRARA